ncbi:hypothetical protein [Hymenobacter terrenus]|uniref:hypothetical protein n=1 Tax=Hymenobacter terrenus TaxID=1629124 RepID=UPI00061988DF|nr:hypothetical protein [Hymenobacter terrenus]
MKSRSNFLAAQSSAQVTTLTFRLAAGPVLLGLLLAGSFISTAQAQDAPLAPSSVQVTQLDAASLSVRIHNPAQKAARLQVVHLDNGRWILNETHRTAAYGTLLKFDQLPAGSYALVLRVGPDRYRYAVQVESKTPGTATIAVRETASRRTKSGPATASL